MVHVVAHSQAGFFKSWKAKNKAAFKSLVESGATPGILAYRNGEPAG